jgi:hypothetical protein
VSLVDEYQMNGDWRYYFSDYFPSDWHCDRGELTRLDLGVLDDIVNRIPPNPEETKPKNKPASLMLTFPLDTEAEGPLIIEPNPDWKLFHHMDSNLQFLWTATERPGRGINVTSVDIQQGSMTSSKTSGAHIAFDTPYIGLPDDTYDFLFLATNPQRVDMGRGIRPVDVVDCNSISGFPNIVLQFEGGAQKLIVRPRQYILMVNEALGGPFVGKCVLLAAKSGDGGEVAIGWAALRGRTVWLDWANTRTGFVV